MRVGPWLRLLRAGNGFTPVADIVAGTCVAGGTLLSGGFAAAAAASVALYFSGMVLNDFADRRADARHRPERPLPRGDIRPASALAAGLGLMVLALALVPAQGRLLLAAMAAGVLLYDFGARSWLPAGILLMGTLRGANLALGALCAAPDAWEGAMPPAGVLVAAASYTAYVAFLTALAALEDRPRPPAAAAWLLHAGPPAALASMGVLSPHPVGPLLVAAAMSVFLARAAAAALRDWRPGTVRGSVRILLLGLLVFTGSVSLGHGRWIEAALVASFVLPARWISRRIPPT